MKKSIVFFLSLLMVCAMATPGHTKAVEPIKIGVPMTLVGVAAQVGIDNLNGIKLAADHKGTILGRPIQLLVEDAEGKAETGVRKAEKLVFKDKVSALLGVAFSGVALAIAGEMDRLNVPFLTTNAMTPKLYGIHPLVFRCGQMADDQTAVANVLGILNSRELAKLRYYVLADDYAWGHSCAESFIVLAKEKSIAVQNPDYDNAALNVTDWSPYISKIAASGATGIYPCLRGPTTPRFIEQASKFGLMKHTRIVSGGSLSESAIEGGGESQLGVVTSECWSWDLKTPKSQAFAKAYWEKFKAVPPSMAAQAYTGAMVLFNAIEKAGSTDPKKIAAALKGATYDGPYGQVRISPKDNCGRTPALLTVTAPAPKDNPYGAKVVYKILVRLTAEEVGPAE